MSGEKWTAGPFWVEGNSIRCNPTENDDGRNVADMVSSRSPEETRANADLLAAAPELYEALRALVDADQRMADLQSVPLNSDQRSAAHGRYHASIDARAALAKARGER